MGGLLRDPAIDRWATMREQTLRHFRLTRKNVGPALIWGLGVPLVIYQFATMEMRAIDKHAGKTPEEARKFPSL
eukprot:m.71132 g.71132  ORF g.71132 m.71132 type:complete len:74 (-) comp14346_c0_seq1:1200-1421(-)